MLVSAMQGLMRSNIVWSNIVSFHHHKFKIINIVQPKPHKQYRKRSDGMGLFIVATTYRSLNVKHWRSNDSLYEGLWTWSPYVPCRFLRNGHVACPCHLIISPLSHPTHFRKEPLGVWTYLMRSDWSSLYLTASRNQLQDIKWKVCLQR